MSDPLLSAEHARRRTRLSLFEKVILANTVMLVGEALAGLWVTSHSLETHHYLLDTSFIVLATLLSLLINIMLLRASFRPLFGLMRAMRAVSAGHTTTRAIDVPADSEIGELAQAFNMMLDQLEDSRRQQATLILQAQEEERRRLARELHDESSQNLTAQLVHLEILHQTLLALPESLPLRDVRTALQTELHTLTDLAQRTLENIRTLALQLRPGMLDDLGLEATLRWLAEDCRQRLHVPTELHIAGLEQALRERDNATLYETTLFRIVQECLTNAARHASARQVSVSFQRDRQSLSLCVSDDGHGFDTTRPSTGLGIIGMRERAALLRGQLTIASQPGQGTRITVRLPLTIAPAKEAVNA
ncbi:MAG: HAMP domain-containing protein [Chloroflexota bacterium]|nr:HAMP domain-containing protein [Chloroflexota bacterium]